MKTPAIIFPEPGRAVIENVPVPDPRDNEVLVGIQYSALSPGTERWCLTGKLTVPGEPPMAFPHLPGYQAAGVVREVGSAVRGLSPGDRVFSRNCRAPAGWKGSWWGGHAGVHVAPAEAVIRLPEAVSTREASGLLLAQVGYNGASKPPVRQGDVAVVIGEGLVGQYAAQVLRHRGARVIISGLVPARMETAARFSADEVLHASELGAHMSAHYPGGVAIAVDTASSAATVHMAAGLLARDGHLVMNGFYPPTESAVDWHWLRGKELTLHCPNSRTRARLEATLDLIAEGAVKVEELFTHELALADAPRAYAMLLDPAAAFLGVVIRWTES